MEECGYGDYIKDVENFIIFKAIVPLYMTDPEVNFLFNFQIDRCMNALSFVTMNASYTLEEYCKGNCDGSLTPI